MSWLRRKTADSLDPQYLLQRAHPEQPTGAFRMTVKDVFSISGRGTVVTGQVESGRIETGATIRQTRADGTMRDLTLIGIETSHKLARSAGAGDSVGLLFGDLHRSDIAAGDVLTA